ncbi:hypothetical protein Y032_0027g1569 [Ancylostoma ceylanicum]|uniref:Uncharacterized protein n=1 Tax=Ancylostoma ceylanicum TaxID=53326 RepID=A0A016USZ2_9BILA|nr:hypothetical protein Y032_0027g1569 [Ancylostoma ceylanicum]
MPPSSFERKEERRDCVSRKTALSGRYLTAVERAHSLNARASAISTENMRKRIDDIVGRVITISYKFSNEHLSASQPLRNNAVMRFCRGFDMI